MRAVGLHADVLVLTSRVWQTTCTIVRCGDEAFVIDSPVYPDELDALPVLLDQAGFGFSGLLATHGDWDHLLGRLAFPGASLGVGETTAARLRAEPASRPAGAARLRRAPLRRSGPRRSRSAQVEALPVPGYCGLGRGGARAAPGRRAHRRRDGRLGAVGAGAGLRGLPLAGRDPDRPGFADGISGDAGPARAARGARGLGRARGTESRSTGRAAADPRVSTGPMSRGDARRSRGVALPFGRGGAEQRRLHAANLERLR